MEVRHDGVAHDVLWADEEVVGRVIDLIGTHLHIPGVRVDVFFLVCPFWLTSGIDLQHSGPGMCLRADAEVPGAALYPGYCPPVQPRGCIVSASICPCLLSSAVRRLTGQRLRSCSTDLPPGTETPP